MGCSVVCGFVFILIGDNMMKEIRGIFVFIAIIFAQNAMACSFSWQHYGDDVVNQGINQVIGQHVIDRFCKYSKKYEIVLETQGQVLSSGQPMCVGWAVATLRPIGTQTQQKDRYSQTVTDTGCRTVGRANDLAVMAATLALDDLMSQVDSYHFAK
jgi:hypothetical protein